MADYCVWLFWMALAALVYSDAGYYCWMALVARWFSQPVKKKNAPSSPPVTVVLVVHNEAHRLRARVDNLLASDYSAERLNVLVVSDGSTDETDTLALALASPRVQFLRQPQRRGKPACLNVAVPQAQGEIIVFADARQRFAPNTIVELVANFSDPQVGAASGTLSIESATSNIGAGVDTYWQLEKKLRHYESLCDSSIGCTGAVYAIRKTLFRELPADTLLDDVVIPMQITLLGHRVVFDTSAVAHDPQRLEPAAENIRKRRTLAGNFQMLFRYWRWLLPWENRFWWRLIAHKYLRLAGPFLLLVIFGTNLLLRDQPGYREILWLQGICYALALLGQWLPGCRWRILSLPAGFLFLNGMVVRGFWHYLTAANRADWQTVPAPTRP